MVFGTGCEPDVDWSLCEEESGFPRVLPVFHMVSAILYASTAVLYTISMARTLRLQLKENKRMSYNTAVQMHAGIVVFSLAAFIHGVVSDSPWNFTPPSAGLHAAVKLSCGGLLCRSLS